MNYGDTLHNRIIHFTVTPTEKQQVAGEVRAEWNNMAGEIQELRSVLREVHTLVEQKSTHIAKKPIIVETVRLGDILYSTQKHQLRVVQHNSMGALVARSLDGQLGVWGRKRILEKLETGEFTHTGNNVYEIVKEVFNE